MLVGRFEGGADAVFFGEGLAGGEGFDAGGAARFGEGGCGDADAGEQAAGEFPAFVEAEEDTGGEGIAGAGGSGDVFLGDLEGGLPDVLALSGAGEGALGEVDDHQFADAHLEEGAGGVAEGDGVEFAVVLADLEPGDFAGLEFIDDEVVGELEGGDDVFRVAIAVFGDDVEGGFEAGVLGFGEEGGSAGAVFFVGLVEGVEEEEVAEVEQLGLAPGEVDIAAVPEGVGAAEVEEGAASVAGLGHDVGVGRGGLVGGLEQAGVDLGFAAIGEDAFTEGVIADEAGGGEGEGGAEAEEVDEDVVGGAPCAEGLALDVGEFLDGGVDVDGLDFVDDPVAGGEDAGAGRALVGFGDDHCHTRCLPMRAFPVRVASGSHSGNTIIPWLLEERRLGWRGVLGLG